MEGLGERNTEKRLKIEKKLKRWGKIIAIFSILAIIFLAVFYFIYSYINKDFSSYKINYTTARADSNTVQYMQYGNRILKFSRDGASGLNSKGETLWNGSFEFKNPAAAVCGEFVIIADIGGKEACVFNGSDSGKKIETLLPIIQADVAEQGVAALMLEDKTSNVLWIYDVYGSSEKLLFERTTNVQEDGYPIDITLSDDGTRLVTSYLSVKNGMTENLINFYNFSGVGQDKNFLVGWKNFKQEIIPKVEFVNNSTICAYGENSFTLYSMIQLPQDIKETVTFESDIKSVFSNEMYVGFILEKYEGEDKYQIVVYNLSGEKVLDKNINFDYNMVFLSGKELVFYSDLECFILRINGKEKFHYIFDRAISYMMPVNNFNKYILIDDTNIQEIQLME